MYNEKLAFFILTRLRDQFPKKFQIHSDIREPSSQFSAVDEEELLSALDALVQLRQVTAGVLRSGIDGMPSMITNIGITDEGRAILDQALKGSDGESGDMDDLLPLLARRRYDKDLIALSAAANITAPLSILYIDLDHFKSVNDSFDHDVGDEVLVGCAKALNAVCSGKGYCYRRGGEELLVLLPNYSLAEALPLAERVREAIRQTRFDKYPDRMTASIGVSSYPETCASADDLVTSADHVMQGAKEAGRDQVRLANRIGEATAQAVPEERKLSSSEIAKAVEAARVNVKIESGLASNFLIEVESDSDYEITVTEVRLSKNDISLTGAGRPSQRQLWRISPRGKLPIAWRADPDPAQSLKSMSPSQGAIFQTEMKIVLFFEILGKQKRHESKVWVEVDIRGPKVIQRAGG